LTDPFGQQTIADLCPQEMFPSGPAMRLISILPALLLAAGLAGCAGGRMGPLPPLTSSQPAASITVQRSKSLWGAPASMLFSIDGQRVYALRWGQQFTFLIDPGEYRFGYDLGFNNCRQRVILDPGERYVLRLNPVCQIDLMRFGDLRLGPEPPPTTLPY
jgi:hypothetical protein